jgi:hypothetical protein
MQEVVEVVGEVHLHSSRAAAVAPCQRGSASAAWGPESPDQEGVAWCAGAAGR